MNSKPFIRKIIYIICIAILVIPLALISRPETRDSQGEIDNPGGQLAQLREKYNLSQAKMSDIDPASETMKLVSLGMRGVAVNVLWMQAAKHRKDEDYDKLSSTLRLLTKIQPNFVKVWEYQAHNLSYNISMEFDDYEQRYSWVKRGLNFLKEGIPHNKRDHRMTDNMGFFTGNKFGKSDEKKSFRRLFRNDTEFHDQLSDNINPDLYNVGFGYGYDSWQLAYLWYGLSRELVEEKNARQYRSDVMFYMYQPSQLRNMVISLQEEFPPSSFMANKWGDSYDQWIRYGNQKLTNSLGIVFSLEGQNAAQDRLEKAQAELDRLVPQGRRAEMLAELGQDLDLSEEDKALIKADSDTLTEQQNERAQKIRDGLAERDQRLDQKLAMQTNQDDRALALKIVNDIQSIKLEMKTMARDAETVNYPYWRTRNLVESQPSTLEAHQALFEAEQVWRQSTYDDEFEFDYKTKTKKITKKGAITLYEEAFELWRPIIEQNPRLGYGQLSDRITRAIKEYQSMLRYANRPWPEDFPLQAMIDKRRELGEQDGLPTTTYLNQQKGITDTDDDATGDIGTEKVAPEASKQPDATSEDTEDKAKALQEPAPESSEAEEPAKATETPQGDKEKDASANKQD